MQNQNKFMLNERDIYINVSNCDAKKKMKKDREKNNLTSNTAITLIALIITIIVLLILAGITLNMIIGNNGIMTKANISKELTNKKSVLEEVKLKILEIQANKEHEKIKLKDVFEGFEESKNFEIIQALKDTLTGDIEKIYVKSNNYPDYIVEIDKDFNCRIVKQADIEVRLESIEIVQAPNKTDYYIGECFAADGMKVIAHYSNGENKEITNYTYNTEALDGSKDEVEIEYEEKGITKTAIQNINISCKPYKIAVNNIATTGFKINLDLTQNEINNIKEIKYYVNNTKEGTNYQTGDTVTGLSDYSKNYVWAIVTYNSGKTQKSSNYQVVYTAHTHNNNCYSETITSRTYYACKYNAKKYDAAYKTSITKWMCTNCNKKGSKRAMGYISSITGTYYDETKDIEYNIADCHVNNTNCRAFNSLDYDYDTEWSEKEYTVYPKYCPKCESNIYDSNNNGDTAVGKCCHYLKNEYLNCGKSEQGSVYDYNF